MKTIVEPSRCITVTGEYDVIVVGGGIAGIAAALAAARNGAGHVLLAEREYALGGPGHAWLDYRLSAPVRR